MKSLGDHFLVASTLLWLPEASLCLTALLMSALS